MTDLTPEQIQQAREIAQTVISYPYRVLTGEGTTLARAVLALTEQPEPAQRESSLAQRIAAQCTCEYPYPREIWAGHHPNCATEQQPEPVSREELTDLAGREIDRTAPDRVAAAFSISRELLSRYTITRKQPEGADHG